MHALGRSVAIGVVHGARALHTWPAPRGVRALLWAEVLGVTAGVVAWTHLALPSHRVPIWATASFFAAALLVPIALCRWHGDLARDSGVRLDNVGPAARCAARYVVPALIAVAAVATLADSWQFDGASRLLRRSARYVAFGPIQQFLLGGFLFRRLHQAIGRATPAAVAASALFGIAHAPNVPLMALTGVVALGSCAVFLRAPNIWVLGWMHGLLAVVTQHAWPDAWLEELAIGGHYLERLGLG